MEKQGNSLLKITGPSSKTSQKTSLARDDSESRGFSISVVVCSSCCAFAVHLYILKFILCLLVSVNYSFLFQFSAMICFVYW